MSLTIFLILIQIVGLTTTGVTSMRMQQLNIAAAFILAVFCSVEAIADIKLGVFPRRPVAATHQSFKALAEYLSEKLGEKVELVVPKDFETFWNSVKNKEFDLVHYNQYHYIKSHKELGYKVIFANEEFGDKQLTGAVTVRKDSGVNSVAELKGKTVIFGGDKMAMASYIAPTAVLKKAGLTPGKDYQVKFAKNPPSAVIGVYNNAADASGSGNVVLRIKAVTKKVDTSQLKILAESELFTQLPWAVKDSMSEEKANKIQSLMTSLKSSEEGKAILKAAKVTDFFAVSDEDYNKIRELTKFAIDEDF